MHTPVSPLTALLAQTATLSQSSLSLSRLIHGWRRGHRYYGRGSRFTAEAILVERAEFARLHTRRLDEARSLYERVSSSRHPLHAALAHLGLALVEVERGGHATAAARAREVADAIGFRLVSGRADELLSGIGDPLREVFFC